MRFPCSLSKVTRSKHTPTPCTHTSVRTHTWTCARVILIAFPRQQWFRERASVLRYTYIASCKTLHMSRVAANEISLRTTITCFILSPCVRRLQYQSLCHSHTCIPHSSGDFHATIHIKSIFCRSLFTYPTPRNIWHFLRVHLPLKRSAAKMVVGSTARDWISDTEMSLMHT